MSSASSPVFSSSSSPSPASAGGARTAQALIAVKRKQGEEGSLLKLLIKLIRGDTIQIENGKEYKLDDFLAEFGNGGKLAIEKDWRVKNGAAGKSAAKEEYLNKDADDIAMVYEKERLRGKHEWIPTSEIAYVAEFCAKNKSFALLSMASSLRSDTEDVIFNPDKYKGFTGHVGALYTSDGKAITTGQAAFHDELRQLLYKCFRDHHADFTAYASGLEAFFKEHCWDGIAQAKAFVDHKFKTIGKTAWDKFRLETYKANWSRSQQILLKDIQTFASSNSLIRTAPSTFSFFMPNNASMGLMPGSQPTMSASSPPTMMDTSGPGGEPKNKSHKSHE